VLKILRKNIAQTTTPNLKCFLDVLEDVYVPYFRPDPSIINEIWLNTADIIVTIRPPAVEAYYYIPESEKLFESVGDFLIQKPKTQLVLLPRNERQRTLIQRRWQKGDKNRKIVIPNHAVDGLNLIWHSDLVISGGAQ
jgi:predicted glycosyltransferase